MAQATNETFEKWIAVPQEAAYAAVTDDYPYQRQAIAAVDGRTTDCCLAVNGQIVDFDADFKLTGDPRPWGDEIHSPPFHWNCRTSAVIYRKEYDDGVTEQLREQSVNERKRREEYRKQIAEIEKELGRRGQKPDARKRKADDKETRKLRRDLKRLRRELTDVKKQPIKLPKVAPRPERPTTYKPPEVPEQGSTAMATAWARNNIADDAYYSRRVTLEQANLVNKVGAELADATGVMPTSIKSAEPAQWFDEYTDRGGIRFVPRMQRQPIAKWMHSMGHFDKQLEGVMRHEWGHLVHDRYAWEFGPEALWDDVEGVTWENWRDAYGVTSRARDNWQECVAENFTLYSIGETENIHPAMLDALRRVTKWTW